MMYKWYEEIWTSFIDFIWKQENNGEIMRGCLLMASTFHAKTYLSELLVRSTQGCNDNPEVPRPYKCLSKYSRVDTHKKIPSGRHREPIWKAHTEKTLRSWASDIDFKHIQHKNWWEVECWRLKQESEMQKILRISLFQKSVILRITALERQTFALWHNLTQFSDPDIEIKNPWLCFPFSAQWQYQAYIMS